LNRYEQIAGIIDQAVALWSPRRAIHRRLDREQLQRLQKREQYAAAKTSRLTGAWSPTNTSVNAVIEASSPKVRARVRQLVRDFPVLANAIRKIQNYTVGSGIQLQSRVVRVNGKETFDDDAIRQIETAWDRWKEEADIAGKLHLDEMAGIAKRQDGECGEFLLIKTRSTKKGRFLPFALQMVEPDWLSDLSVTPSSGAQNTEIRQGIEYDRKTCEVLAYHLVDPDDPIKAQRYKSESIIHGFETLRPGQLRGISILAAGVLLARDIDEMMQAELDAAKMAAKYLSFVTTADPAGRQNSLVETDSETQQKIESMENAIIEYLRPGEKVEIASNPRPGANFAPFIKLCLRFMAIATGIPYAILSGDYEQIPYSSGRMVRNDMNVDLVPVQTRHVRHFYTPVFRTFLDEAVISGRLVLPGYWQNPQAYQKCEWFPPIVPSPEPLKDMKTDIEGIRAGLRSPYEVAKSRGKDAEEVLREIAKFNDLAKELGVIINLGGVSTADANNPASLMDIGDGEGDGDRYDA